MLASFPNTGCVRYLRSPAIISAYRFLPTKHAAYRKEQLTIVIDTQVLSALHLCKSWYKWCSRPGSKTFSSEARPCEWSFYCHRLSILSRSNAFFYRIRKAWNVAPDKAMLFSMTGGRSSFRKNAAHIALPLLNFIRGVHVFFGGAPNSWNGVKFRLIPNHCLLTYWFYGTWPKFFGVKYFYAHPNIKKF